MYLPQQGAQFVITGLKFGWTNGTSPSWPDSPDAVVNWIVALWHQFVAWVVPAWSSLIEWLSQPHIIAVISAFWITFIVVVGLFLTAGFGPAGIVAGSLAAAFQSYMYGAFTPAGGIFATFTSMAMVGILIPPLAVIAFIIAFAVATIVWAAGVGR